MGREDAADRGVDYRLLRQFVARRDSALAHIVRALLAERDAQATRLAVVDNPLVLNAARAWASGCAVPQCDMCRAVAATRAAGAGEATDGA